jgi:DNA-binding PadR family transcriptional regulator
MNLSQDLVKGTFVPIILSLLKEQPMYGYQMVQFVNARSGGRLEWREGTLYPTLHRLEGQKLIRAKWQQAAGAEGGRQRKYYFLTPRGLAELAKRATEWQEFSAAVNALVLAR